MTRRTRPGACAGASQGRHLRFTRAQRFRARLSVGTARHPIGRRPLRRSPGPGAPPPWAHARDLRARDTVLGGLGSAAPVTSMHGARRAEVRGTSVGDTDRVRAVADHVARTRRHGDDVVVVVSAMGKTTDDLLRLAGEVSAVQPPRELDMLLTSGERVSMALCCAWPSPPRRRGRLLHREPGRDHHRHRPHEGEDRRGQGGPPARGAGRGPGARGGGLPGRVDRPRRDDARARRVRHDRGGPRRRPRCRRLRDLHRRVRGVQRRSPDRPRGSPPAEGQLRGDARDLRVRRAGADAAFGRVRPQSPCPAARPFELHLGAGDVGHRGGRRLWSRPSSPPSPTTTPRRR